MTGAATTVDVNTLRTSTSSITNALAGNVAGIMARQTSDSQAIIYLNFGFVEFLLWCRFGCTSIN